MRRDLREVALDRLLGIAGAPGLPLSGTEFQILVNSW